MTTQTNPNLRTGPALEIKLAPQDAERGLIEGYGATFDGDPDRQGDIIRPGAFAKSLARELPAMVWAHDLARPVGRWLYAVEDGKGLRLRGQLNLKTEAGRQAHEHVVAGDVRGLSIGYIIPAGGADIDRKTGNRILSVIDLFEVSPVSVPAMPGARITSAKSFQSQRELQSALHETGLSRTAAAKIAAVGWPVLNRDQDQPDLNRLEARIKAATAALIRSTKG